MNLLKAASLFSSGTFLSRISGLLRDMATAAVFGATGVSGAFFVAFRLSQLFRRLLGESPLTSSFIPLYSRLEKGVQGQFFRDVYASLSLVLIAIIGISEGCLYPFRENEIVYLTMLMFPSLYFIVLFGLASAKMQVENRFFLSGVAPMAFNLVWIVSLIWIRSVEALACIVVLGFFVQWLFSLPSVIPDFCASFSPFSRLVKEMIKPFALGIAGVSANQINSALDVFFARAGGEAGPAYLFYAMRFYQLPLSLIGIALSTALLPRLVQSSAPLRDAQEGKRMMVVLIIPATIFLMVLAPWIVKYFLGRGAFDEEAIWATVHCLWGYAPGLIPACLVMQQSAEKFADRDYRQPALAAVGSVIVNLFLNTIMVFIMHWGAVSVAIATSMSAYANYMLLKSNIIKHFIKSN
ncbi:MAG: murein biosynthesis integral membrane protein MurJ [Simkaniaceae bacterium]|nr:murein biosynthesis integral membrane protein MurJ [Simkaniaceae bacterium]